MPRVVVSSASRVFDRATGALGIVLAAVAVVAVLLNPSTYGLAALLAVPVITVMCWLPMRIGRSAGTFDIGFDFCVLVFLACLVDPSIALMAWALGQTLGQLFSHKRGDVMLFNVGIGVISGAVSLAVFMVVRDSAPSDAREVLAAGIGAAAYFVVDYGVTAVSIALEQRTGVWRQLRQPDAPVALAAFLAISSLGYLAAIMVRALAPWTVALVAVPVATILVAVRARARGNEQSRRLRILLKTSTDMQSHSDEEGVLRVLVSGAADMLRDPTVRLSPFPPGLGEVGAAVRGTRDSQWLVAPAADRVGATGDDDFQGLLGLAKVAETGLDRLELGAEISRRAWHDALTGLANRALFLQRLEIATTPPGPQSDLKAVLFCDLDGFKRVNDLAGHVAGDALLVEVARRLKHSVRAADTVARLGGDEFAVLLEGLTDAAEVERACERILSAVRDGFEIEDGDVSVSVTIGVAIVTAGATPDALLSRADLAMYHAKARGKDRFETYRPDMGHQRIRRLELVESLRRAIDAGELTLQYQTVHDLRGGQVYGVEGLARWRRDGVDVPPDLFVPAAEEGGLIVGLGQLVLELFTADVPAIRAALGRRLAVGINVSAQQLQRERFAGQVLAARSTMGDVDLVLEVTERDFVNNDPKTLAAMDELAAADVRFAVDDFGIGFSSIGYLHRLPVRILKIDKSFVAGIEHDAKACSLVRSIVVMGNALGLDVVAEGVERDGQAQHLMKHAGATTGQGYLYQRPMALPQMVEFLSMQPTVVRAEPPHIDVGQASLAADHLQSERLGATPAAAAAR